jgi:hypothetical protein
MRALTFALACLIASSAVAADRKWQTGTWGEISTARQMVAFGPGQSSFDPPNAALQMQAMAEVRVFTIVTGEFTYELRDTVPITRRSLEVLEGSPVTFAVEKNTVYVRDKDGTEHKLRLTKKTATSETAVSTTTTYAAMGGGHLLRERSTDGRFLMLEDGSRWEIHPRDRFQTEDWEPNASLTVRTTRAEDGYGYEIVNTQTDEGALARFVPRR